MSARPVDLHIDLLALTDHRRGRTLDELAENAWCLPAKSLLNKMKNVLEAPTADTEQAR